MDEEPKRELDELRGQVATLGARLERLELALINHAGHLTALISAAASLCATHHEKPRLRAVLSLMSGELQATVAMTPLPTETGPNPVVRETTQALLRATGSSRSADPGPQSGT